MRTAAAGFVLGYLVIALLIAPSLLCALGAAPSYPDGVAMVLNRSGVLEPLQRGAKQAVEIRDHVMSVVDDYLSHRLLPRSRSPQD
jgi:hypothetical protein